MSLFDFKERDVVRVKVKLCEDNSEPVYKKFAIDPRITNYEVLQRLLTRGFDLKCDFNITYLATDDYGDQFYLPMLSDWDLDAAILTAADPTLRLKVQMRPIEEGMEDWDIVVPGEVPLHPKSVPSSRTSSFLAQLSHQMERTVNTVQKAIGAGINKTEQEIFPAKPLKQPMNDSEFRNFMDSIGRIVMPAEFRHSVYLGGFEPSLRKVGWRLLLNVYPSGMNGKERLSYLQQRSDDYSALKTRWKDLFAQGKLTQGHLSMISLIKMDVMRTDRTHSFYAGDKNQCILFDLLVTYSIYHPSVGYSQGMSDLASPLLFVQADEASAYVCFCALMIRMAANFSSTGHAMITKLQHLHDLMVYYDPDFAAFLRHRSLGDMFFAHRWLVLDMKREFLFEESLKVLEVQWASLPVVSPGDGGGVALVEEGVDLSAVDSPRPHIGSPKDAFVFMQSFRRRSSSRNKVKGDTPPQNSVYHAGDATSNPTSPNTSLPSGDPIALSTPNPSSPRHFFHPSIPPVLEDSDNNTTLETSNDVTNNVSSNSVDASYDRPFPESSSDEFVSRPRAMASCSTFSISQPPSEAKSSPTTSGGLIILKDGVIELPPPEEMGHGNPFLLFLCMAILFEYREPLIRTVHEMFDMAIFFRKMNQRHCVERILNRARSLYDSYLREQETKRRNLNEYPELQISL